MKERIDILLVEKQLVESRTKAQWLIRNGFVSIDGRTVYKPGKKANYDSYIQLSQKFPFVGRGGFKLDHALKTFSISIEGKICVDIGASIGGFTDCLLKNGASKVYVIDTAEDLLHPSLRSNPQVIKLLGVDARKLKSLREQVDITTVDVTFTSIRAILPNIKNYLKKDGDLVALVKPLFEIEFREKKKLRVIKKFEKLKLILLELINWGINNSIHPYGISKSPILGKGGSIEFLIHFKIDQISKFNYKKAIEEIFK